MLAATCAVLMGSAVTASASEEKDRAANPTVACIESCADMVGAVLDQERKESMSNRDGVVTEAVLPVFPVETIDDARAATQSFTGCITDCLDVLE